MMPHGLPFRGLLFDDTQYQRRRFMRWPAKIDELRDYYACWAEQMKLAALYELQAEHSAIHSIAD